MYTGVPSLARASSLREIRFLSTEVCRKKVLKISQSLRQGAISVGGFSSNCRNKSSTVTFPTGAAFSSFPLGFCGFSLGGCKASERFLLSESQSRLWKS